MLSFPQGTEMFQFPHLPPPRLCVQRGVTGHDARRVAPFGDRRCSACLRPTGAFRSLPRPSSAPVAEASTPHVSRLSETASRPRPCPAAASESLDTSLPPITVFGRRVPGQPRRGEPSLVITTTDVCLCLTLFHLHLLMSGAGAP